MMVSILLVMFVVYLFLRDGRAAIMVPALPCRCRCSARSASMYLLGYSLDNFSLMALTVSTGFRGRRRDRGSRERHTARRRWHAAASGDATGRAGGRVHGPRHEHFADRRVPSHSADGRHHRPLLPRIRHGPHHGDRDFADRLADDDADDVRAIRSAHARARTRDCCCVCRERSVRRGAGLLWPDPGLVAGQPRNHHVRARHRGRAELLSLFHRSQGLLPDRGHRSAIRRHPRRSRASPSSSWRRSSEPS